MGAFFWSDLLVPVNLRIVLQAFLLSGELGTCLIPARYVGLAVSSRDRAFGNMHNVFAEFFIAGDLIVLRSRL